MITGEWVWATDLQQSCQIVETQTLWGNLVCRVWVPAQNAIVRLPADQLQPLPAAQLSPDRITYITAAARIAAALSQDVLLAPMTCKVIPLPHQLKALSKAVSGDRIRYLLADEVGLGKTIEAGLIIRELKLRGLARRILVVAPKGLVPQWVSEMQLHFNEAFQLVLPEDLKALRRIHHASSTTNPWKLFDQAVCPMDSVKPIDKRKGWTQEQVADYNRDRFEAVITAGWDLVIIDEAHRLGGSTDQVARYRLGQGLAESAPYLLLLSATPHQGKTDAFHRLIALLDPAAFPDPVSLKPDRVQPYIIRTEKRQAIDAQGQSLFKPRHTQLIPVSWSERDLDQQRLYESVTDYVREGYNQAIQQKKPYIGFLMILMQRLVTSSTRAIRATLERRLEALREPEEQTVLFPISDDEWIDLDGQEQIDTLLTRHIAALQNEKIEVERLLELAKRTEATAPDVKAEALLHWIYQLQQAETDPTLKVLIFTEFVSTQEMLAEFLSDRNLSVVCLNGSMDLAARQQVQHAFANKVRVLISTDAGGEGLNLQFCHIIINYDIPWNPMRLEQRIGRVDRIGQVHPVCALNFVLQETVEYRVREVLEAKLELILKEFGVDKTGDVLDSAQAGVLFDDLYIETLLSPDQVAAKVETMTLQVRDQVQVVRENSGLYASDDPLDPVQAQQLLQHPIAYWLERMTVAHIKATGGTALQTGQLGRLQTWDLHWQSGEHWQQAVFAPPNAAIDSSLHYLTLEEPRLRGLVMGLLRFAEGQPLPCVHLPGLPSNIQGIWSLWQITLYRESGQQQRVLPIFCHDNGKIFLPTAKHIWEQFLTTDCKIKDYQTGNLAVQGFQRSWQAALTYGKPIYDELLQTCQQQLEREKQKAEYAFAIRRRTIQKVGLPQVKVYRLNLLNQEVADWQQQWQQRSNVTPDLLSLLILRVEGDE